ncbi:hypothetical protein KCU88_g207, partial [Aureobasidium melanogenum]
MLFWLEVIGWIEALSRLPWLEKGLSRGSGWRWLSSERRNPFLEFVVGVASGHDLSQSMMLLSFMLLGRSSCRCCSVDLRKDDDRLGIVEKRDEGKGVTLPNQSLSSCERLSLNIPPSGPSDSNMLKAASRSPSPELLFRSGMGDAFPLSLESARTRFEGLFGEVRMRVIPLGWAVRRRMGRWNRVP